jgi:hypothetical protein
MVLETQVALTDPVMLLGSYKSCSRWFSMKLKIIIAKNNSAHMVFKMAAMFGRWVGGWCTAFWQKFRLS